MGAIPNPKVTMEFSLGTVGWQESHIYGNNVAVTDAVLYADMAALAYARAYALGGDVVIRLVKASQEQINRDVAYLKRADYPKSVPTNGYAGGPFFPGSSEWAFQSPHLSWPLKLNDAFQNQIAITYLAGMPAWTKQIGPGPYDVATGSGKTPGQFIAKYAEYLVIGSKWGVASRTWPGGPFPPAMPYMMGAVPLYVPAGPGHPAQVQFTITNPVNGVTLVPGSWIRVGGIKYNSPQRIRLNGSYQVFSVVGTAVVVNVPRLKADPGFATPGYVQAATYTFQAYRDYTIDDITHKKRGRVVSSPAGRRSAR